MSDSRTKTILLAGASRGLGLGLTAAFLDRGWNVIATARNLAGSHGLHALMHTHRERLTLKTLDVADLSSIGALAASLSGPPLDVVFVVAGISTQRDTPIEAVSPEAVAEEFITNATGPVAVAEALLPRCAPSATIAFMTSILGSIASNAGGGMDLYRASKAALNMLAVCFARRHKAYPVMLFHPGWVRTELGGSGAPLDIETSVKGLADQIEQAAKPGIAYLDYQGQTLPW
jgi:NAD(P)-dependent dehydrogenase (short-subunit alcohol dehydrogenase family)